jgi:protein-S-isoprenylcysteine O-methyltransferase Ste14
MSTRALVVLSVLVASYALVFGLRSVLHRRRTGAWGFLGSRGLPGALFIAGVAGSFAAPVLVLAGVDHVRWTPGVDRLAAAIALVGLAGTFWAQGAMGRSWRIGVRDSERTELVTAGPFRWVRNPIFSFMILGLGGATLALPSTLMLAALATTILAVELQVRLLEEPYLARTHGEGYAAYRRRAGRFVPGLG